MSRKRNLLIRGAMQAKMSPEDFRALRKAGAKDTPRRQETRTRRSSWWAR